MRTLFITSEVAPFVESDQGAAVVTLAKVLRRSADHKVTILAPLLGTIDPVANSLARRLTKLTFDLAGKPWSCELYTGRNVDGTELMFIGNEEVLRPATAMTASDQPMDATRTGVFCRAVVELLKGEPNAFEAVHGHGWLGAAAVASIREWSSEVPTVVTVYDAEDQGQFSAKDAEALGIQAESNDDTNMLAKGIRAADHVTALSPNYAARMLSSVASDTLGAAFAGARNKLVPVRHGIDSSVWNPITDPLLAARFDPFSLEGKWKCKADLQRRFALPVRGDVPIIAAVGRTEGDQMDLLAEVGPAILRNDVQWFVVLEGHGELVARYEELWDEWPDRLQIRTSADNALLHSLLAASDFVIVPGRTAPTANIQMCAQRYGALPIVHRDGGLADTVVDCEASLRSGSGFLYDEASPESLMSAVDRAIVAFNQGGPFRELQGRAMRLDHSWERTARLYERVYENALAQAGT